MEGPSRLRARTWSQPSSGYSCNGAPQVAPACRSAHPVDRRARRRQQPGTGTWLDASAGTGTAPSTSAQADTTGSMPSARCSSGNWSPGQRLHDHVDSLVSRFIATGSASPRRAHQPSIDSALDPVLTPLGAHHGEGPVVVGPDTAAGDVGVFGSDVRAELAPGGSPPPGLACPHETRTAPPAGRLPTVRALRRSCRPPTAAVARSLTSDTASPELLANPGANQLDPDPRGAQPSRSCGHPRSALHAVTEVAAGSRTGVLYRSPNSGQRAALNSHGVSKLGSQGRRDSEEAAPVGGVQGRGRGSAGQAPPRAVRR